MWGLIPWPARSLDLTPLDFLWGFCENYAFFVQKQSISDMVGKIKQATTAVNTETLEICKTFIFPNESYYKGKCLTHWNSQHMKNILWYLYYYTIWNPNR